VKAAEAGMPVTKLIRTLLDYYGIIRGESLSVVQAFQNSCLQCNSLNFYKREFCARKHILTIFIEESFS